MLLEQAVKQALESDAAVTTHCGIGDPPIGDWRIYPLQRPQAQDLTAAQGVITYQRISGGPGQSFDGLDELVIGRIQIDCWATTYALAKDLAKAVRDALNDATNGLKVGDVQELDNFDDVPREYRVILDMTVSFTEST